MFAGGDKSSGSVRAPLEENPPHEPIRWVTVAVAATQNDTMDDNRLTPIIAQSDYDVQRSVYGPPPHEAKIAVIDDSAWLIPVIKIGGVPQVSRAHGDAEIYLVHGISPELDCNLTRQRP